MFEKGGGVPLPLTHIFKLLYLEACLPQSIFFKLGDIYDLVGILTFKDEINCKYNTIKYYKCQYL